MPAEPINRFAPPFGMEQLATVDSLVARQGAAPTIPALRHRSGGQAAAARKDRLLGDRELGLALERLAANAWIAG